jgi:hypothetical protein
MSDREKLLEAERLIKEVEDNLMPPSWTKVTLNTVRKTLLAAVHEL